MSELLTEAQARERARNLLIRMAQEHLAGRKTSTIDFIAAALMTAQREARNASFDEALDYLTTVVIPGLNRDDLEREVMEMTATKVEA